MKRKKNTRKFGSDLTKWFFRSIFCKGIKGSSNDLNLQKAFGERFNLWDIYVQEKTCFHDSEKFLFKTLAQRLNLWANLAQLVFSELLRNSFPENWLSSLHCHLSFLSQSTEWNKHGDIWFRPHKITLQTNFLIPLKRSELSSGRILNESVLDVQTSSFQGLRSMLLMYLSQQLYWVLLTIMRIPCC